MQQTSLSAYSSMAPEHLAENQLRVYNCICKYQPLTNRSIAKLLGMEINTVTPRTLELREMGFVVPGEDMVDPQTGRKAVAWKTKHGR